MINYSIGITTYDSRFEKYLIPLINTIKSFRPNLEIILTINGNYNEKFNQKYRQEILQFISQNDNIFPIVYPEFRSLSKLWNTCLINSSNDLVLILNDDISILDESFFDNLESQSDTAFKINGSWSHYFIDRKLVSNVGWFDERLLGIGEEDGDFEFRWESKYGIPFKSINIDHIVNHVEYDNACKNMQTVFGKYSKFNRDFMFNTKYKLDFQNGKSFGMIKEPIYKAIPDIKMYEQEEFYWNNRDKL